MAKKQDHPGVKFPPPFIFLGFTIAGILIQSNWMSGNFELTSISVAGILTIIFGVVILLKGARKHKDADTNIEPWKPTINIISSGLYGISRNPLYVAMAIVALGIAMAAGSYVAAILIFPILLIIRYYVIAREEAYLEREFGEEYLAYKQKVRRLRLKH